MNVDRVTVSLPSELRIAAQSAADEQGVPFSNAVANALSVWLRGQELGRWLADYQTEHGAFTEDELMRVAAKTGVPYIEPANIDPK
jgi:hypothetical protein